MKKISKLFIIILVVAGCTNQGNKNKSGKMDEYEKGSYGYDFNFLKEYINPVELRSENACVLLAPGLQGRVMTSSANGMQGKSFGWVNYNFFEAGKTSPQFNPFGGEERFWLGPEGGPWSIYFKPGDEQVFANWKVPELIDTEPFETVEITDSKAVFSKKMELVNYSGNTLNADVNRTIKILSDSEITHIMGIAPDESLLKVAFETENILKNSGSNAWNAEDGALSIWLLSMFNPSEEGVVFIAFKEGDELKLGKKVTDDYFGKVPAERLIVKDNILFFKTDGKYRSKIGIPPKRALSWCGSYDPVNKVLTLLWYSKPSGDKKYVNSVWGDQDDPLSGDVVNSYNDGPADNGSVMGPFYEIESSSPAAMLSPGESISHTQRIFHISGEEEKLSLITEELFNLSISEIKTIF